MTQLLRARTTDSPHSFKIGDATSYDPVAAQFGRFAERLSAPLATRLIALAQLGRSPRILDVGSGTGLVARDAGERFGPGGRVLGIDLSEGMLAVARSTAARAGLDDRVAFARMDAECLGLEDGAFDAVLSLFALLHFPDPRSALREMFRVLRPGGRLVIGIGSRPPWLSWDGWLHRLGASAEMLGDLRGKRLVGPNFLNALVLKAFPKQGASEETAWSRAHRNRTRVLPDLVRAAGFRNLKTHWEGHQAVLETPEEFWDLQCTFSSMARKRLSGIPKAEVEALRQVFMRKCREVQSRGGKLVYPFAAFFVAAER